MQSGYFWYMSHCQSSHASESCLHGSAWVFSPSTIEMSHRDVRKAPFFNPGGPEHHRRKPAPIKRKWVGQYLPLLQLLWSALLWGRGPTVRDDNESRKEANDSVVTRTWYTRARLIGAWYEVMLFQAVWLSSSRPCSHAFMTQSYFHNEIFMNVTLLPKIMCTGVCSVHIGYLLCFMLQDLGQLMLEIINHNFSLQMSTDLTCSHGDRTKLGNVAKKKKEKH